MEGVLIVDKPDGFTSFDVVAKLRGILKTRKIGHAGTLDPMATGVLPVLVGGATKAADLLPDSRKRYTARLRLGVTTDTQDITGTVLREAPVSVSYAQTEAAALSMRGELLQTPPMYSAVKIAGRRLYDLAREGKTVPREARPIVIETLSLTIFNEAAHEYELDVLCSKGTYIRTLCHDIGEMLGCGAVMTYLRRTMAAGFTLEHSLSLTEIQRLADAEEIADKLLPVQSLFHALPAIRLLPDRAILFQNGVRIQIAERDGRFAVYGPEGFLGLADTDAEGRVLKRKLLLSEDST